MKLNDLIQKYLDHKNEYIQKSLYDGGVVDVDFHLTINGVKYFVSRTFDDDTFNGEYSMCEDVEGEPYFTTLSKFNKYRVADYSVESICEKYYNGVVIHFYLEIKMEERTYPTLEEFMNTYLKDVPYTQKDGDEEYFTSIIVYKGEIYRRSPDMLFKFRHYKVHKCYHGKIDLFAYHRYTPKESPYDPVHIPRYTPPMYVIFLRKQRMGKSIIDLIFDDVDENDHTLSRYLGQMIAEDILSLTKLDHNHIIWRGQEMRKMYDWSLIPLVREAFGKHEVIKVEEKDNERYYYLESKDANKIQKVH